MPPKPSHLGDDGIHLLHAQGNDAGEEGLEHLAGLLHHHLQDLQELLHHPAAGAALVQDALRQLLSAGQTTAYGHQNPTAPGTSLNTSACGGRGEAADSPGLAARPCCSSLEARQLGGAGDYLVNMLRKVCMICSVKGTPIWTLRPRNSVRKKLSISSVTSEERNESTR